MGITFSTHETPKPKGIEGETTFHARVRPQGTKHLDEICEYISEGSSLTSADLKGALEAFFNYVSTQLRRGFNVELEGLGHFSVALRSEQVKNEKGKNRMSVAIDGVNFRCSPRLKKAVRESTLKKVRRPSEPFPQIRQRQRRMEDYLRKYGMINQRQYAELNGCSRYCAVADLKKFQEQEIVVCSGNKTHKVYFLASSSLQNEEQADRLSRGIL